MKKVLSVIALAAMLITAANSHALTIVQGEITSNTTWSGDVLIKGPVFVRSGATLTVEAGSIVYGEKASTCRPYRRPRRKTCGHRHQGQPGCVHQRPA